MPRKIYKPEEIIAKLGRAVSDMTLEKLVLKEAASGNF